MLKQFWRWLRKRSDGRRLLITAGVRPGDIKKIAEWDNKRGRFTFEKGDSRTED